MISSGAPRNDAANSQSRVRLLSHGIRFFCFRRHVHRFQLAEFSARPGSPAAERAK